MAATEYRNAPQERMLDVIFALAPHVIHGLAPIELANALKAPRSTVLRDLHVLRLKGCAEQIPETGRWRLGPRIPQISLMTSLEIRKARDVVDQAEQRYSRTY